MENTALLIVLLILAYLTGSIPFSLWAGKIFFRIDIREHGSGNAGATNAMRVLGLKIGFPVLLLDILKGWAAVKFALIYETFTPSDNLIVNLSIALGVLAVLGHIFPLYAKFKGGKGVATIFGVLLALHPLATSCAAGIFLISLFITRYVSLSSILAGLSFPIWIIFVFRTGFLSLEIFSAIVAVLIIITHHKNIHRLLGGKENKADFLFKGKMRDRKKEGSA
jgi:glycerol-3-phosphate acyltransferase PlsY